MEVQYKKTKKAYFLLKYEFVKKIYHALNEYFQTLYGDEFLVQIRGSWGVWMYGMEHNRQYPDTINLESIYPDDLDINLCYKTSKHDKKLNLTQLNLVIDGSKHVFATEQNDESSKTFSSAANLLIKDIDISRKNSMPYTHYLIDGMETISPNELLSDYSDDPEFKQEMTDEKKRLKRLKQKNKKNIMKIIIQSRKVPVQLANKHSKSSKKLDFSEKAVRTLDFSEEVAKKSDRAVRTLDFGF